MKLFKDWLWAAFAGLMALCVVFLSSLPAQADAVANAQTYVSIQDAAAQTPERWTQTYETEWRTIEIDAPVTVPDVDALPILRVQYLTPLSGEKLDGFSKIVDNNSLTFYGQVGTDPQAAAAGHTNTSFSEVLELPAGELPDHTPENNPLTYAEARQIAIDAFRGLYGIDLNEFDDEKTWLFGCVYTQYKGKLTERLTERGYYWLDFQQRLAGVPLESCWGYRMDGGRGYAGWRGVVGIEVVDAENYRISTTHVEALDQPQADVPLLPFEAAKAAIEAEIMAGHVREIESVELCYTLYNDPADEGVMWAVPVWRAYCVVDEDPAHTPSVGTNKRGETMDFRSWEDVVFEAQRGTLLDWNDRSAERRDVPPILGWDDVK